MKKQKFATTAPTLVGLTMVNTLNKAKFTPLEEINTLTSDMSDTLKNQGVTAIAILDAPTASQFSIPSLDGIDNQFTSTLGAIAKKSNKNVVAAMTKKGIILCQNKKDGLDIGMISGKNTSSEQGDVMALKNLPKAIFEAKGKENTSLLAPVAVGLTTATIDTKRDVTFKPMPWIEGKVPTAAAVIDLDKDQFKKLNSFQSVPLSTIEMKNLTKTVKATISMPKKQTGNFITAVAVEGSIICFETENPTSAVKIPTTVKGMITTLHG